ncbi:14169_t:CDS:1, partial [Funneliformis geosporum]
QMGYQKTLAPKTTSSNSSSCSGIRNNFEYPSSLKRRLKSGGMKVLIIGSDMGTWPCLMIFL